VILVTSLLFYRALRLRGRIPLVTHHASGHAYITDLQRLATAIAPKRVVPIHSFAPARFGEFFDNVEVHREGEWWEV
jgi:ribonuclease J